MQKTGQYFTTPGENIFDSLLKFNTGDSSGRLVSSLAIVSNSLNVTYNTGATESLSLPQLDTYIKAITKPSTLLLRVTNADDSITNIQLEDSVSGLSFSPLTKRLIIRYNIADSYEVDLSSLQTFNITSNKVIYVNSNGTLAATNLNYSDIVDKVSTSEIKLRYSKVTFNSALFGGIYLPTQDLSTQDLSLPSIFLPPTKITAATNDYSKGRDDTSTILLKDGILKLFNTYSGGGGGITVSGTPGNLPKFDSEGSSLEDSDIATSNLVLKNTSSSQVIVQSRAGFYPWGFALVADYNSAIEEYEGGIFVLYDKENYVQFIKNDPLNPYPSNRSLVTETCVKSLIHSAELGEPNYLTSVLEIVTTEPVSPTTRDTYAYNGETTVIWSSATINPGDIIVYNVDTWGTTAAKVKDTLLNEDNGHYYRYVQVAGGSTYTWFDIGTLGMNDHDTAGSVRGSDGNPLVDPTTGRHLIATEIAKLLGGGTITTEHLHRLATTSRSGYVDTLPNDERLYWDGIGNYSEIKLGEEASLINILSTEVNIEKINTRTISAVREGNKFRYNFVLDTSTAGTGSIKLLMPTKEYVVKGTITNNYGEAVVFIISNKNLTETSSKGKKLLNIGHDSGKSYMKFGYDTGGDYIYISENYINKTLQTFNTAYGNVKIFIDLEVSYYSVPGTHDIVITSTSNSFTSNLIEAPDDIFNTDNTWNGVQTFNKQLNVYYDINMDGSGEITNAAAIHSFQYLLGGLSTGDKLVYNATGGIIKDVKEQTQTITLGGTAPTKTLDLNINSGKTGFIEFTTMSGVTDITVSYSNMENGDEFSLYILNNSSTDLDITFPSTGNRMINSSSNVYTMVGGIDDDYLVVIKKINSITFTIIEKL